MIWPKTMRSYIRSVKKNFLVLSYAYILYVEEFKWKLTLSYIGVDFHIGLYLCAIYWFFYPSHSFNFQEYDGKFKSMQLEKANQLTSLIAAHSNGKLKIRSLLHELEDRDLLQDVQ